MEQLFEKYQNIQLFATSPQYRNYKLIEPEFYDFNTFKSNMQILGYVSHTFENQKTKKPIDIYFFKEDSKYISSTNDFKKILDKYKSEYNIIMITKHPLNVYRMKSIKQYSHLNVKNYLHKIYIMEINKGSLCSKHTVLSPEENKRVCYELLAHAHKLPAISESDPQNIWIGGEVNDVIRIDRISEISGHSINYRIVTPASGKVLQSSSVGKLPPKKIKSQDEDNVSDNGEDYNDEYDDSAEIDETAAVAEVENDVDIADVELE
jgi:DNA-directed RNA polymerase subunit H (RpoH/RPB5)